MHHHYHTRWQRANWATKNRCRERCHVLQSKIREDLRQKVALKLSLRDEVDEDILEEVALRIQTLGKKMKSRTSKNATLRTKGEQAG